MEQFKGRVDEIKSVYSKKINNKNKFKDIIWNKLEEEKGEIFKKWKKVNFLLINMKKNREKN